MKLLYATSNEGKAREVRRYLEGLNIELVTLKDLKIDSESPETGETLEENAVEKLNFYRKLVPDLLIMADDTGLEIEALGGKPGVHVRRWKNGVTKLSDEEALEYCLQLMQTVPAGKRQGKFRTVIAIGFPQGGETRLFSGQLNGEILTEIDASVPVTSGVPFNRVFYVPEWQMTLGHIHGIDQSQLSKYLTHRAKAVLQAVEYLKNLKK